MEGNTIRVDASEFEVIRRADAEGNEKTYFEGRAIKYNTFQRIWEGRYEQIKSGAMAEADTKKTKCRVDHNRMYVLGRTSGKTLTLIDKPNDGLYFSVEKPNTTLGNDVEEQIKRGDFTGCSFEARFDYSNYKIEVKDKKEYATLERIKVLDDVAIVYDPAYSDTSVKIMKRSFEAAEKEGLIERTEVLDGAAADAEVSDTTKETDKPDSDVDEDLERDRIDRKAQGRALEMRLRINK